jgi:hypothetical protein
MKGLLATLLFLLAPAISLAETWPISITDFATGEVLYYGEQQMTSSGDAYQTFVKINVDAAIVAAFGFPIEWWPPLLYPTHPWVISTTVYPVPTPVYPRPFPPPFDN